MNGVPSLCCYRSPGIQEPRHRVEPCVKGATTELALSQGRGGGEKEMPARAGEVEELWDRVDCFSFVAPVNLAAGIFSPHRRWYFRLRPG